jgi:hypothetical protein
MWQITAQYQCGMEQGGIRQDTAGGWHCPGKVWHGFFGCGTVPRLWLGSAGVSHGS